MATLDLIAHKRTPWAFTFAIVGFDYSAGAFAMQVRQRQGDTGAAVLTATLTADYDPTFTYWDGRRAVNEAATTIEAVIAEVDLEAIPLAADPSKPVELYYDLHITPPGQAKRVLVGGKFSVYPGVTI